MIYSIGIHWKLNGGRLENKGIGTWEYSHKSWILPKEGATPDYIRMSPEDIDYTEDGEACETRCGNEGTYNGRNWCWKVSGSWNYCAKGIQCKKIPDKTRMSKTVVGIFQKYIAIFDLILMKKCSTAYRFIRTVIT